MFYACGTGNTCVSSYLIDSLLTFFGSAGGCPAASHFLLLRQKKVTKEKATLFVVPALRYGHVPVLGQSGVLHKLASLKQVQALIRFALCSSPPLQGLGKKFGFGFELHSLSLWERAGVRAPRIQTPHPVLAGLEKVAGDGLKNLDVRRRQSRQVSKFSVFCNFFKEPRSGPDCGSPFFSLGFFGEAKKSKSPAGASPGMLAKRSKSKRAQWQQEASK